MVIPKSLRDQSGITAGEVEITLDGAAIRIESAAADELVEQDGFFCCPPPASSSTRTRSGNCDLVTNTEHVLVDTSATLALVQRENPLSSSGAEQTANLPPGYVRACRGEISVSSHPIAGAATPQSADGFASAGDEFSAFPLSCRPPIPLNCLASSPSSG